MLTSFLRKTMLNNAVYQRINKQQMTTFVRQHSANVKQSKLTFVDSVLVDVFFSVTLFLPGYLIYTDTKKSLGEGGKSHCNWLAI